MVPTTNVERNRIIQCPKVNGAHLRVTPPNQVSQAPSSPNKSAQQISKIPETQQSGRTNRRNSETQQIGRTNQQSQPNSAANLFFLGGGGGLDMYQHGGRHCVDRALYQQDARRTWSRPKHQKSERCRNFLLHAANLAQRIRFDRTFGPIPSGRAVVGRGTPQGNSTKTRARW